MEAERCPECGYEPSAIGFTDWLIILPSILVLLFCLLALMFWFIVGGAGGLGILGLFGFGGVVSAGILYGFYYKTQRLPVDG